MQKIVIIGGGFAGLWSAVSAARRLEELGRSAQITLVNLDRFHSIRVRNYEAELEDTLVSLADVLEPIDVHLMLGRVVNIDASAQQLVVEWPEGTTLLGYDKLILCSGSKLAWPDLPGFYEHCFNVDTYIAATCLQTHIDSLSDRAPYPGQFTALVLGSGATGVEIATELPARLFDAASRSSAPESPDVRVILADRAGQIAAGLGGGQTVIERACGDLGIELRTRLNVVRVDARGVSLDDGSRIDASTVVWCGGMLADDLTVQIPGQRDPWGRLHVDAFMRVAGAENIYAAGDTAHTLIDGVRPSVMSCQHARPMGRYAGTNVVNELFGEELQALHIDWYTNITDLGPWGAVYTQGRNREVVAIREEAKRAKTTINRVRIYPPLDRDREKIIASGSTSLERPPKLIPLS